MLVVCRSVLFRAVPMIPIGELEVGKGKANSQFDEAEAASCKLQVAKAGVGASGMELLSMERHGNINIGHLASAFRFWFRLTNTKTET